ncbi:hypothetical protein NQD34_010508 [Periophthalmus magnuspinnatus]|nr:hypothetical protein NQD34_010508 [Periophthalmus magnuspinnatus]
MTGRKGFKSVSNQSNPCFMFQMCATWTSRTSRIHSHASSSGCCGNAQRHSLCGGALQQGDVNAHTSQVSGVRGQKAKLGHLQAPHGSYSVFFKLPSKDRVSN